MATLSKNKKIKLSELILVAVFIVVGIAFYIYDFKSNSDPDYFHQLENTSFNLYDEEKNVRLFCNGDEKLRIINESSNEEYYISLRRGTLRSKADFIHDETGECIDLGSLRFRNKGETIKLKSEILPNKKCLFHKDTKQQ